MRRTWCMRACPLADFCRWILGWIDRIDSVAKCLDDTTPARTDEIRWMDPPRHFESNQPFFFLLNLFSKEIGNAPFKKREETLRNQIQHWQPRLPICLMKIWEGFFWNKIGPLNSLSHRLLFTCFHPSQTVSHLLFLTLLLPTSMGGHQVVKPEDRPIFKQIFTPF